jgi:hypothetical protein
VSSGGNLSNLFEASTAAFVALNALALGGGAWRLRDRGVHEDWGLSLICSTVASVPGGLVLIDLGARVIANRFDDTIATSPPAPLTLWIFWLWALLLSPVLMLGALLVRERGTPSTVYGLQLVQLAAWCWSVLMTLFISVPS